MKNDYCEYFLLDSQTVLEYIKDKLEYFDQAANLKASEIGDGNINYVFRVIDEDSKRSLVVKQADKLLRSSGRPLDQKRNEIEAEVLRIEYDLSGGKVPQILDYDENMRALIMEDISDYKNLRKELMDSRIFENFSEEISSFMVDTLLPTTDLIMDRHDKKDKVKLFINKDLCEITEDLVLTEPYYDYKSRNVITDGMLEFVEEKLYGDEDLKAEVGHLRNNFMNKAQALIHGDLHSGSIFIKDSGIKVIDPEFAFYGPMGYDIGNVIGNLFFALANKTVTEEKNDEFLKWSKETIKDTFDLTRNKLNQKFEELVEFPLYNEKFRREYIGEVMSDSLGYTGTELIRRTVGDSKVVEITSLEDRKERIRLEKILINLGISLIKNRHKIDNGRDLIEEFERAKSL